MGQIFDPPETHDEKHWVTYGNVVLCAVSSQSPSTLLFRVHSSLLSEQSEVFASMFEMPQGEGGDQVELYEGLPLVRLPDSSEEVSGLLDALRDPLKLSERTIYSDTPIRIRDALRMTSKYLMTDLRAKLVRLLENEWPLTVDDLELKDHLFLDYINRDSDGIREHPCLFWGWPLHLLPEPAAAIALAEEYDIQSILPAAYYDIMRCSPRKDWDDTFGPRFCEGFIASASQKPARWDRLSRKAFQKIHYIEDVFEEEMRDQLACLECLAPEGCRLPESKCEKTWKKIIDAVKEIPTRVQDRDFLGQLRCLRINTSKTSSNSLCQSCRTKYMNAIREARKEAWVYFKELSCGAKQNV